MATTLLAVASGPLLLGGYFLTMKQLPARFPHWVVISNGFFCYLVVLVTFIT